MTAEEYTRWTAWWRVHPHATGALVFVNRLLKYLCYLLYPALLVIAALGDARVALRLFVVPLVGFALVSVVRRAVNEARPYEALDIEPLIHKGTHGKSFPSRHIFSIFMIAMSWLYVSVPMGVLLLALGCVMAAIRVLGGVHYLHDVLAGAALGIAFGLIGYWAIPW